MDVDGSRIEIVFDFGDVKVGEFVELICELEFELFCGDMCVVLKLVK